MRSAILYPTNTVRVLSEELSQQVETIIHKDRVGFFIYAPDPTALVAEDVMVALMFRKQFDFL